MSANTIAYTPVLPYNRVAWCLYELAHKSDPISEEKLIDFCVERWAMSLFITEFCRNNLKIVDDNA